MSKSLIDHLSFNFHHNSYLHDVGLLRNTLLESISLDSGLAIITYTAARATNRVEAKDWLWPSGQIINAWWSAVGVRMYNDVSFQMAFASLTWSEKLLLSGVTAWGLRLFYRIASRSIARGKDDPRYDEAKKEDGFWKKAFFGLFIPEAICQGIISLPFTLPFRTLRCLNGPEYAPELQNLAVGLFSAGFALEAIADWQVEKYRQQNSDLAREGVWSIVRHPNYLGDALIHASFPLLAYSNGQFNPLILLGPLANYAFLRFIGGDKQNEEYQEARYKKEDPVKHMQLQEWRLEKNSFWPKLQEIINPWTWIIVSAGVSGVFLEHVLRS